jgi:prepilin-type processing-associated H-X9-DG protein
LERLSASLGEITEAAVRFECCIDVSFGGVLFSLPALLSNGLLHKSEEYFQLPDGYYGLLSVLIILAFLVLLRVKSLEGVRYMPPGELGKLVGLDRIPEVKTLRKKLGLISDSGNIGRWQNELSRYWMESSPMLAGYLYVDGHVRTYYGKKTKLPRRYVSRERLCLRGMTDYWVNDALGQPFFVVSTALTGGLLSMLREEIIPRLLEDVPNQPSLAALKADQALHRFVLLFDREGYSPAFFEEMFLKHRIACMTYKKYPGDDWPASEFKEKEVVFKNGEKITIKLAERHLDISRHFWVWEIRKLSENGHQTAIISSNYKADRVEIAAGMFQRWSQENFFKYMMENFGIDRLIEYETRPISDTAQVVTNGARLIKMNSRQKDWIGQ